MYGSLALHQGVVWVGREARTASVRPYDLDGRPLGAGFRYRDERSERSSAAGLSVDDDFRVWAADTPADRVRAFNAFGREVASLGGEQLLGGQEQRARMRRPVAVHAAGAEQHFELYVALAGENLHGVLCFDERLECFQSLRSHGSPEHIWRRPLGLAAWERRLWVLEGGARCIQVFDSGSYVHEFKAPAGMEPRGLAPMPDGRLVLACGSPGGASEGASGLWLLDASGRPLRELAAGGPQEGAVDEPGDVVVVPARLDREARVVVIDKDGTRVQVFTLLGRCYGSFDDVG